jgi:activator of 2-hydroxyglutaryl-CoA dehydratase
MPKLTAEEQKLVRPIVRDIYADAGQAETKEYIKRTTGIDVSKFQLARIAREMNIVVSKEARARMTAESNKKRMTEERKQEDWFIREHYRNNGGAFVAEKLDKPIQWVVGRANALGITLSPELKEKQKIENIKKRERNKKKDRYSITRKLAGLSKLERLALYEPWGKYERTLHENFMENWPR